MNDYTLYISLVTLTIMLLYILYKNIKKTIDGFSVNDVKKAIDKVGNLGKDIANLGNQLAGEIQKVESLGNEICKLGKKMINKDTIVLLNKSDIQDKQKHKFDTDTVLASVKKNENIDSLIKMIKEKLSKKFTSNNTALITRERHRVKLNECLKEIDNFLKKDQNKDLELAAEDLRMATRHLGSIVGKVDVEEILGSIFKDFCIGK